MWTQMLQLNQANFNATSSLMTGLSQMGGYPQTMSGFPNHDSSSCPFSPASQVANPSHMAPGTLFVHNNTLPTTCPLGQFNQDQQFQHSTMNCMSEPKNLPHDDRQDFDLEPIAYTPPDSPTTPAMMHQENRSNMMLVPAFPIDADIEPNPLPPFPAVTRASSTSAAGSDTGSKKNDKPTKKKSSKKGKAKKKKPKNGLEKPKRPLSAYNLFFQSQRQELLAQLPVRAQGKPKNSHGKCGFQELAKIIGAKWRNLDNVSRNYFDKLAVIEKKKYDKAVKYYKMQVEQLEQDGNSAQSTAPAFEGGSPANTREWTIAELAEKLGKDGVRLTIKAFS